jgi:hypothetical protein
VPSVAIGRSYFSANKKQGGKPCPKRKTGRNWSAAPQQIDSGESGLRNSGRLFPDASICPVVRPLIPGSKIHSRLSSMARRQPAAARCLEKTDMDYRKVYAGKPDRERGSLCDTCVYSRMIRGYAESEHIGICDRLFEPLVIRFRVRECSDYADKRLPSVESMREVAWMLVTNKPGRPLGFVNAAEYRETEEREAEDNRS